METKTIDNTYLLACGEMLLKHGELQSAKDVFMGLLGSNPQDANVLFSLGRTLLEMKQAPQAKKCFLLVQRLNTSFDIQQYMEACEKI